MSKSLAGIASLPKRKPECVEPMECALVAKLPDGPDWTFEIKLDGYRAVGVKTSPRRLLHAVVFKGQVQIEAPRECDADYAASERAMEQSGMPFKSICSPSSTQ
jgi:hypothetical protein